MAAAEASGDKINRRSRPVCRIETVITSAAKGLAESVQQMLDAYYKGEFPGGESINLDAARDGVQLPMENSRFEKFTQEDYDAIYKKLVDNEIAIKGDKDVNDASELASEIISVTLVD